MLGGPLFLYLADHLSRSNNLGNVLLIPDSISARILTGQGEPDPADLNYAAQRMKKTRLFQYDTWLLLVHYARHFSAVVLNGMTSIAKTAPLLIHMDSCEGFHSAEVLKKCIAGTMELGGNVWQPHPDRDMLA